MVDSIKRFYELCKNVQKCVVVVFVFFFTQMMVIVCYRDVFLLSRARFTKRFMTFLILSQNLLITNFGISYV